LKRQAAAFGQNRNVLINCGDKFDFLLHPLMQGRVSLTTRTGISWESLKRDIFRLGRLMPDSDFARE